MNKAIQELPTYIQEKVSAAQVPIKYTAAIKALAECRNIDEAKYFADKSDALAAWAKIYQHDEAAAEAKRLKLHAYRRMGVLAQEIQPRKSYGGTHGSSPGPAALLRKIGLKKHEASSATALSRLPSKEFHKEVALARPHAPSFFVNTLSTASEGWLTISTPNGQSGGTMAAFRCFCRKADPKKIAKSLHKGELQRAREMITEIIEWADTFDQYLPKE